MAVDAARVSNARLDDEELKRLALAVLHEGGEVPREEIDRVLQWGNTVHMDYIILTLALRGEVSLRWPEGGDLTIKAV